MTLTSFACKLLFPQFSPRKTFPKYVRVRKRLISWMILSNDLRTNIISVICIQPMRQRRKAYGDQQLKETYSYNYFMLF